MGDSDRLSEFEARLQALKHKMESGLAERARTLREMAARVEAGDAAARKLLKTESHKLRGVAGSYGHNDLSELAAQLEQRASVSPPATVGRLARELADLADVKARSSRPPKPTSSKPPRKQSSKPPLGSSNRPKAGDDAAAPKLRVLAMDDDPVTQRLLTLTLTQVGGFDATIVHSATDALELLKTQHFDVVLSDAMMPDMNGREFRRAARAAGVVVPIVILSAASAAELGWTSEQGGADSWLRKPFKPSQLVKDILRIAGR